MTTWNADGGRHTTNELPSGTVVHTWSIPNPRGIVILQHGFAEYAERYVDQHQKLIPQLNMHGFNVRAMDLWGHGRSPGTVRGVAHVERAVREHTTFWQQTGSGSREDDNDKLPIFLFGHSLGGLITAASAVLATTGGPHSARCDGVILTGPALADPLSTLARRGVGLAASVVPARSIPLKPAPIENLCRDTDVWKSARDDPLMLKRQIPFLLAATALRSAHAMWGGLSQWRFPTLVIHGAVDRYTDPAKSRDFIDRIASTDKSLCLLKGGCHEPLNDLDREEVLDQILNWLEGHLRK